MRSPSNQSLKKKLSQDLENWMSKLPDTLKNIPIIYLAIPGTHDSFTANITSTSGLAPDAEPLVQCLSCFGPIFKFFIANWSRTQTYTVKEQLNSGIRYFDLRLATKQGSEDFYFVHALYSEEITGIFNEIEEFLETHPGEVVIIDCQHFYAFTQDDHERLMAFITNTFKTRLLPYSEHMESLTLKYMTDQCRYQVITIYRSDASRFGQPFLWPAASFPTPWPNTDSRTELFQYLDSGLQNRNNAVGYVSQCVLTPSTWFVTKHLYSTLKKKCAIELEDERNKWISEQSLGAQGLNIVIGDYIELNDHVFCKNVIELNTDVLNKFNKKSHNIIDLPKVHTTF